MARRDALGPEVHTIEEDLTTPETDPTPVTEREELTAAPSGTIDLQATTAETEETEDTEADLTEEDPQLHPEVPEERREGPADTPRKTEVSASPRAQFIRVSREDKDRPDQLTQSGSCPSQRKS